MKNNIKSEAKRIADDILILDTHIDVPYRLESNYEDISQRTEKGDFDYVRAVEGGLNAPFMSVYIPASYEGGAAKELGDKLIKTIKGFTEKWPDKFVMAYSPEDIISQFKNPERLSIVMGMENGSAIEGDLNNVHYFYDQGIRYITLCHSKNNHICDSSYDDEPKWNGLSPFGKKLIKEMNKTGMMIDVSHITDLAFYDVIGITETPVIASHSSCRKFTPGWERNMDDQMIRVLADNGGVIQINFGSTFLSSEVKENRQRRWNAMKKLAADHKLKTSDPEVVKFGEDYWKNNPFKYAGLDDVIKHIKHVVDIAGIDHVGLGSDFDGVGDSLPEGLKDVSDYPNLIAALLKSGFTREDIRKICGGNLMRVWSEINQYADNQ